MNERLWSSTGDIKLQCYGKDLGKLNKCIDCIFKKDCLKQILKEDDKGKYFDIKISQQTLIVYRLDISIVKERLKKILDGIDFEMTIWELYNIVGFNFRIRIKEK